MGLCSMKIRRLDAWKDLIEQWAVVVKSCFIAKNSRSILSDRSYLYGLRNCRALYRY